MHPEFGLRGVDFASGSLGQGLSLAAGAALGARLQQSPRRAFAPAERCRMQRRGSIWEAVMFAAHHKLANLIAFVDLNGQQALGYTDQVLSLRPLAERWRAFGWDVHEVDGHNPAALEDAVAGLDTGNGSPHVFIARTIFGKGVSYIQNQIKWHYWPMSDAEYKQALQEIGPAA